MNLGDVGLILRLLLDICVMWTLIYACIRIIRNNSRTVQIVKGILALLLFQFLVTVLQLKTVSTLLDIVLRWGMIVVLIVLQPEIRSMLEKVGTTNTAYKPNLSASRMNHLVDQLVTAVADMSKTKTGALISLQMAQSMEDYAKTGISLDSDVTSELIETIFQYGTPMHDGAMIIDGDKAICAAAYFPSTAQELPSKSGARHRAAVGISEVTDSITLVVSEETGNISVAQKGVLTQYTPESLRRYLTKRLVKEDTQRSSMFQPMIESAKNFSNSLGKSLRDERSDEPVNKYIVPREKRDKKDDRVKPLEVVSTLSAAPASEPKNSSEGGNGNG